MCLIQFYIKIFSRSPLYTHQDCIYLPYCENVNVKCKAATISDFCVTWSYRNHSILIWWNISYYHCWKPLCCFLVLCANNLIEFAHMDHKTSHKGPFFETDIYTSSESWINKFSIDVWVVGIGRYLVEIKQFENLESKGAKKSKYWENSL